MNGKLRGVMDEIVRETEQTGTAPAAAPATDASALPRIPAPHLVSPAAIPSALGIVLPAV